MTSQYACARTRSRNRRNPRGRRILALARALIAAQTAWTGNALARDHRGHPCEPDNLHAVQFCLWGAILRAACELCRNPVDADVCALAAACVVARIDDPFRAVEAIAAYNDIAYRHAERAPHHKALCHRHVLARLDNYLADPAEAQFRVAEPREKRRKS